MVDSDWQSAKVSDSFWECHHQCGTYKSQDVHVFRQRTQW